MSEQLSFFSAGFATPTPADLDGLLAGPGHVVRHGGEARVSVVLSPPDPWRVQALTERFAELGLGAEVVEAADGAVSVRTWFTRTLLDLAVRWSSGALTLPPTGLHLDGPKLRWWCLAGGRGDGHGYLLPLHAGVPEAWERVGAALGAAGVAGTFLGVRGGGPAYRVAGTRRLSRLRELVGAPPPGCPPADWPSAGH